MTRVSYTDEYSDNQQGDRFPKIKLERNETKRILCPEPPWSEYTHDLRLPKVVDGQQLFDKRKRQDGSEFTVPDTVWLANVICLGDKITLKQQGLDPVNCPACAASQTNKNIPGPKRRYAMNVVEYGVLPNGQLSQPFSARYIVWAFTAKMFDQLIRISNEHNGQMQSHDLRIGPPEEPVHFQRYPIAALPTLGWQEAGQAGFAYLQALTNAPGAKATDDQLRDHCGTVKSAAQMTSDVNRCVQEWTQAETSGASQPANPFAGQQAFAAQQAMGQGFGNLIDQQGQQQPQFAQGGMVQQGQQQPQFVQQQGQQFPQPGASPFGAPTPQQGYAQPAPAQGNPFGAQPPAAAQQGQVNPFQAPPGTPPQHPLESQAAMASAQQQQMAQTPFAQQPQGNPFGPPGQAPPAQQFPTQQPAQGAAPQGNPFSGVAPVQGGGLAEFSAQTTSNPSPESVAQQAMQQQQFAAQQQQGQFPQQQGQFPQQPGQQPQGFAPVQMQVPGQPPQQQPGDLDFRSFFPQTP